MYVMFTEQKGVNRLHVVFSKWVAAVVVLFTVLEAVTNNAACLPTAEDEKRWLFVHCLLSCPQRISIFFNTMLLVLLFPGCSAQCAM